MNNSLDYSGGSEKLRTFTEEKQKSHKRMNSQQIGAKNLKKTMLYKGLGMEEIRAIKKEKRRRK